MRILNDGEVPNDIISMETFTAKVVTLANQYQVPRAMLTHMKLSEHQDIMADRLIYNLKTYIAASGEDHVRCNVRWPADWWQAVKDRWFPIWAKKRWPVTFREHQVDRTFHRAMCPHIEIPAHRGNEVHFQFLKDHSANP